MLKNKWEKRENNLDIQKKFVTLQMLNRIGKTKLKKRHMTSAWAYMRFPLNQQRKANAQEKRPSPMPALHEIIG